MSDMEPTTPSPCPYVFGPYPCAKVDGHGGVHLGALDGKWTRPEAEHEAPRVVGSTPKGRTLVAVAEVLEAHEVPGFTSLADVITDRLFDEGVIAPPARLVAVCIRCRVSAPAIDTPWCRQCLEDTMASFIGPTTARDALEALDTLVAGR